MAFLVQPRHFVLVPLFPRRHWLAMKTADAMPSFVSLARDEKLKASPPPSFSLFLFLCLWKLY